MISDNDTQNVIFSKNENNYYNEKTPNNNNNNKMVISFEESTC